MSPRPVIQIAFADDHRIVRQGITDFIHNMNGGFRVFIEADNGEDLLYKMDNASYQPDICILDISMPAMNGYETISQLQKRYPFVRSLVLTSLDNEFAILKMMKLGASGYIGKNAHPSELEKALLEIYTMGTYFSETVTGKFPRMNESNIAYYLKGLFNDEETKFLSLCCSDLTYREIAQHMDLSPRTVEHYATRLCEKLEMESRIGLAMYALYAGIGNFNPDVHLRKNI